MQNNEAYFYQTQDSPSGLIASDDVVLLEINCQWAERGGTNTDLIRGVIQAVLDHPGGFTGEIIVADNGQAQFGSNGRGGSLNWANANAADRGQSVIKVIQSFQTRGYHVTGVLWDDFTTVKVQEFSKGDKKNGFVVGSEVRSTGLEITYPKFTTEYGTHVSFKEGIWNENAGRPGVVNESRRRSTGDFRVLAAAIHERTSQSRHNSHNGRSQNSGYWAMSNLTLNIDLQYGQQRQMVGCHRGIDNTSFLDPDHFGRAVKNVVDFDARIVSRICRLFVSRFRPFCFQYSDGLLLGRCV